MRDTESPFMDTVEVMDRLDQACREGDPFSLVRMGHAEMFVIRYHTWGYDMADFNVWKKYCGITHLDAGITDDLVTAVRHATVLGIHHHTDRWQRRMQEIFDHYELNPQLTCSAWVTHYMVCHPEFPALIRNRRIAVVGRRAPEAIPWFAEAGAASMHPISLDGFEDIRAVQNALGSASFDVALIAGGVPATILCPHIADLTGKIALDFGHALDLLIDGVENIDCQEYYENLVSKYNAGGP